LSNFCSKCGQPLSEANFCPNCGAPVQNKNEEFVSSEYRDNSQRIQEVIPPTMSTQTIRKNRKNGGCLVFFMLFFIVMAFAVVTAIIKPEIYQNLENGKETSAEDDKQRLLEFDKQTWKEFKLLYTSHNNFLSNVSGYSDNNISSLDFYNSCSDAETYFQKVSTSFNYGANDYEKNYLSVFETVALSDQLAAQYLMKYIDTEKTSHLSKAQEYIQRAKDGLIMISQNRSILLADTGLTQDEIKEKVEKDLLELDAE
jgi:uncharacterized Zn finger protein (UPF0148 family)